MSDAAHDAGPVPAGPLEADGMLPRLGRETLYVLTAFPLGVLTFVLVVTGVATGIGTLIVWVGVPVLAATLVVSSWLARFERLRLSGLLRRRVVVPEYLNSAPGDSWARRLLVPIRDPQSWLDAVWGLLAFATGTAVFVVAVTWWSVVVAGLSAPLWLGVVPQDDTTGLAWLLGLGDGLAAEATVNVLLGAVFALALPWVIRGCAWVQAGLADLLLNSRGELGAQVRRAEGARAAAQQAEAVSFRRLERDIHDGPQQRLVRLTMDLGLAKRQIGDDPQAQAALDSALTQARETLDELRALSRGIAPPLLVDRGLGVALDELVVRSAVPVDLHHVLPAGLTPHVETAVYFTVSEALTNVAKHAGASAARVRVVGRGTELVVEVRDDGVGGAHPGKGQGLVGLVQRLAAVEGTLDIDSPLGGPTTLTARISLA